MDKGKKEGRKEKKEEWEKGRSERRKERKG